MIFTETNLRGAFIIEIERQEDYRGFFARSWCQREYEKHGLNPRFVQCNVSFNKKKGTLRGMHYQVPPYAEVKLVRCTTGSIYDVIIDLRPESPTFMRYCGIILSAENRKAVYIPENFAHGFQTLENNTEVFYQMSEFYVPESARGIRWDDPAFGVQWPPDERIISHKDRAYPDFRPEEG